MVASCIGVLRFFIKIAFSVKRTCVKYYSKNTCLLDPVNFRQMSQKEKWIWLMNIADPMIMNIDKINYGNTIMHVDYSSWLTGSLRCWMIKWMIINWLKGGYWKIDYWLVFRRSSPSGGVSAQVFGGDAQRGRDGRSQQSGGPAHRPTHGENGQHRRIQQCWI